MRHTPPRLATYLLKAFAHPYQREALIGDLLEEHARGRSSAWYWWQVLCVLGNSAQKAIRARLPALVTLAAWWGLLLSLSYALGVALFVIGFDPSIYWWLNRRRKRRQAAREVALLMVLIAVLCLPWGLPQPVQAAPGAAEAAEKRLQQLRSGSAQQRRAGSHDEAHHPLPTAAGPAH